jgi:hypothetical protein
MWDFNFDSLGGFNICLAPHVRPPSANVGSFLNSLPRRCPTSECHPERSEGSAFLAGTPGSAPPSTPLRRAAPSGQAAPFVANCSFGCSALTWGSFFRWPSDAVDTPRAPRSPAVGNVRQLIRVRRVSPRSGHKTVAPWRDGVPGKPVFGLLGQKPGVGTQSTRPQ